MDVQRILRESKAHRTDAVEILCVSQRVRKFVELKTFGLLPSRSTISLLLGIYYNSTLVSANIHDERKVAPTVRNKIHS